MRWILVLSGVLILAVSLTWKAENQLTLHLFAEVEGEHEANWYLDFGDGYSEAASYPFTLRPDWSFHILQIPLHGRQVAAVRLDPDHKPFEAFKVERILLRRGFLGSPVSLDLEKPFDPNQLALIQPIPGGGLLLKSTPEANDPYLSFALPPSIPGSAFRHFPVYFCFSLIPGAVLFLLSALPRGRRWEYVSLLAIVATALVIRNHYKFFFPAFYAEGGFLFFPQIYFLGLGSLTETYNGYHHLLIRLGALIGHQFPVFLTPAVYLLLAVGVHFGVIRLLYCRALGLQRPWVWALATMAVSQPVVELYANLTNIQWFTAILLVALAVTPLRKGRDYWHFELPLLLLAGLTGPFIVFLLPVFFLKYILSREKTAIPQVFGICLLAAVQVWPLIDFARSGQVGIGGVWADRSLWDFVTNFLIYWGHHALGSLFLLTQLFFSPLREVQLLVAFVLLAGAGFWLTFFFRSKAVSRERKQTVILLLAVVVCLLFPAFLRTGGAAQMRYFFIPNIALLVIVATLLANRPRLSALYCIFLIILQVVFTPRERSYAGQYFQAHEGHQQIAPLMEAGQPAPVRAALSGWHSFFPEGVLQEDYFSTSLLRHRFDLFPETP